MQWPNILIAVATAHSWCAPGAHASTCPDTLADEFSFLQVRTSVALGSEVRVGGHHTRFKDFALRVLCSGSTTMQCKMTGPSKEFVELHISKYLVDPERPLKRHEWSFAGAKMKIHVELVSRGSTKGKCTPMLMEATEAALKELEPDRTFEDAISSLSVWELSFGAMPANRGCSCYTHVAQDLHMNKLTVDGGLDATWEPKSQEEWSNGFPINCRKLGTGEGNQAYWTFEKTDL